MAASLRTLLASLALITLACQVILPNITRFWQTSYLSIFLQKHIFKILKIYPQKARKSQHF